MTEPRPDQPGDEPTPNPWAAPQPQQPWEPTPTPWPAPAYPPPPTQWQQQPPPPQPMYYQPPIYAQPVATNGLATGSMVTGIVSTPLLCCCYLGLITGVVAVILGVISYQRANQLGGLNRSYAIVGIATGAAPFIVLLVLMIFGGLSSVMTPGNLPASAP